MEPLAPKSQAPRDPFGQEPLYAEKLDRLAYTIATCEANTAAAESSRNRAASSSIASDDSVWSVVFGYAAGHDLRDVWAAAESAFNAAERALSLGAGIEGMSPVQPFAFSIFRQAMPTYAVFAVTACMAPSRGSLQRFFSLVMAGDKPEELFDRLAHVFEPDRPLRKVYPKIQYVSDWTKPVRSALALPAEKRAAALAAHMKNWPALMRPFGLKTKPKAFYDLFPYFAFEIALSVCAYDIDDSTFRDHPFYPRELVDHYRTHIRMTRDAARPIGIDPGMPDVPTVRAARADLVKSKRKGLARWVELVTSGDGEAVDAVIERIGKPRKVSDVWELMTALTEDVAYAVQADIKDDASVAAQAEALAARLELGEFVPPEEPPAGVARVEQVSSDFEGWLGERGYRLVWIETDDDAVQAVAVRQDHLSELLELGAALGIRAGASPAALADPA